MVYIIYNYSRQIDFGYSVIPVLLLGVYIYLESQIYTRLFFFLFSLLFNSYPIKLQSHPRETGSLRPTHHPGGPSFKKKEFVCETPSPIIYYLRFSGCDRCPAPHFTVAIGRGLSGPDVRLVIHARRFACDFITTRATQYNNIRRVVRFKYIITVVYARVPMSLRFLRRKGGFIFFF